MDEHRFGKRKRGSLNADLEEEKEEFFGTTNYTKQTPKEDNKKSEMESQINSARHSCNQSKRRRILDHELHECELLSGIPVKPGINFRTKSYADAF